MRIIRNLALKKDPNLLNTIRRIRGSKTFEKMSGIAMYRWAKKLWSIYGRKENWGNGTKY